MFYTYILKSLKSGRYYIGYTANLNKRLNEHNSGRVMTTKREYPWILFYYEKFYTQKNAIKRERQLKSWKSRRALERLKFCDKIEDPRFVNRAPRDESGHIGFFVGNKKAISTSSKYRTPIIHDWQKEPSSGKPRKVIEILWHKKLGP